MIEIKPTQGKIYKKDGISYILTVDHFCEHLNANDISDRLNYKEFFVF